MNIPKSWADITLEQYADIYDVAQQTCEYTDPHEAAIWELEKRCKMLSVVTGETFDSLMDQPTSIIKQKYSAISFISDPPSEKPIEEFYLGGYKWFVNYDISKTTGSDFINISELTKEEQNKIYNAPDILSIFCTPFKETVVKRFGFKKEKKLEEVKMSSKEKTEILKLCPITIAYPLTVFFCKVMTAFAPLMEDYLIHQVQTTAEQLHQEATLLKDALGS